MYDRLEDEVDLSFNPHWGPMFKEGNENSRFGSQVEQYACLYTSRVSNFLYLSPMQYLRAQRDRMPHGNATVVLRPELGPGGSLVLDSSGKRFGDPGFYRLDARGPDRVRVWHIRSLKEKFQVYVDAAGTLRCDHSVRFLGLPVLRLHYKMFRARG